MRRWTIEVELDEPSVFGLAEDGVGVYPEGVLPTADTYKVGVGMVGGGTPSEYRSDGQAIDEAIRFGEVEGHIRDNVVRLSYEASEDDFWQVGEDRVAVLLRHFAVSEGGQRLTFRVSHVEDDAGKKRWIERINWRVTWYYLDQVRGAIRTAQKYAALRDERLDAALHYYDHAEWLRSTAPDVSDEKADVRHAEQIIAEVFLNLWKAVTIIVGDPSRDRDHQRRYRSFGLDESFREHFEVLNGLRNDADVAHSSLDREHVAALAQQMDEARDTARLAIRHYREFLLRPAMPSEADVRCRRSS